MPHVLHRPTYYTKSVVAASFLNKKFKYEKNNTKVKAKTEENKIKQKYMYTELINVLFTLLGQKDKNVCFLSHSP